MMPSVSLRGEQQGLPVEEGGRKTQEAIDDFAVIYVYELTEEGWRLLPDMPIDFTRDYLSAQESE